MSSRPELRVIHGRQEAQEETMPAGTAERAEVALPADRDTETAVTEVITGPPVDPPEDERPPIYATVTGRDAAQLAPIVPAGLCSYAATLLSLDGRPVRVRLEVAR